MTPPVTAILIVKNERESLPACLEALSWCQEIIVIDSGSTDGSQEYCTSMGCSVYYRAFEGYGKQKQYGCSLATNTWILNVDADEILSRELSQEIQNLVLDRSSRCNAYKIPRRFCFLGKKFMHGHGSRDFPIRLFRKTSAGFDDALVHESVHVDGAIGICRFEMLHDSYRSIEQYFEKFNRYTSLAALQLVDKRKQRSVPLTAILIPLYFIKHYLVWGHYRNGWHGLVWAVFSSIYPFVKVAKAHELLSEQRGTTHRL